jgi:hypothetical protein
MAIRHLEKSQLTDLVRSHLPNTRFEDVHIWDGMISEQQLRDILNTVTQRGYDRDALTVLEPLEPARKSVAYQITYPGSTEDITFEVVNTQMKGPSPHGYLGHIFRYDKAGNEVRQVTIEQLS